MLLVFQDAALELGAGELEATKGGEKKKKKRTQGEWSGWIRAHRVWAPRERDV